jgi:hypothetical protein
MSKVGRPRSKWRDEYILQAEIWCSEHGGDRRDLARHLHVSRGKLYDWIRENPEFLHAIHQGTEFWWENVVPNIERDMEARARNGRIRRRVTTTKKYSMSGGRKVLVEAKVVVEETELDGDQRAAEFVLINRNPSRWQRPRETQDLAVTLAGKIPELQIIAEADLEEDDGGDDAAKV